MIALIVFLILWIVVVCEISGQIFWKKWRANRAESSSVEKLFVLVIYMFASMCIGMIAIGVIGRVENGIETVQPIDCSSEVLSVGSRENVDSWIGFQR